MFLQKALLLICWSGLIYRYICHRKSNRDESLRIEAKLTFMLSFTHINRSVDFNVAKGSVPSGF